MAGSKLSSEVADKVYSAIDAAADELRRLNLQVGYLDSPTCEQTR